MRPAAWYAIGASFVLAGAVALLASDALAPRLRAGGARVRAVAQELGLADSVEPRYSAIDQRYRQQRAEVDSMKAVLLRLAAAESAFIADWGRPTTTLPWGAEQTITADRDPRPARRSDSAPAARRDRRS
jgi:hypothetical protein